MALGWRLLETDTILLVRCFILRNHRHQVCYNCTYCCFKTRLQFASAVVAVRVDMLDHNHNKQRKRESERDRKEKRERERGVLLNSAFCHPSLQLPQIAGISPTTVAKGQHFTSQVFSEEHKEQRHIILGLFLLITPTPLHPHYSIHNRDLLSIDYDIIEVVQ